jgi:xanthine dehydrogenase accessory factor
VLPIIDEILRRLPNGEVLALCTVVASKGSTPQEHGAKMLVLGSGQTLGTLGGGCVEAEVRSQALKLIVTGESKLLTFRLDHDYGWDDGLICGGVMDIYVRILSPGTPTDEFTALAGAIRSRTPAVFSLDYTIPVAAAGELAAVRGTAGEAHAYREEILPTPRLLIAGAGHVGQALADLAHKLDFDVTVVDDRADCASVDRFPNARCIVGEIEAELARFPIDLATYVVIVTRGHRHDGRALAAVIDSPARYVGLIGSKRKVRTILDDLEKQGVSRERLLSVHAPIGLEIGAVSVPEIAVSIAAELIAVRRGRQNVAAQPMKLPREALETYLDRDSLGTAVKP